MVKGLPTEGSMAARWWFGGGEGLEDVVVVGAVEDMVVDGGGCGEEVGDCVQEVGGVR